MSDNATASAETFSLCVVGAGIAGLNALYVASEYLGPTDRVLLVDAGDGFGGMWNATYPYVRLHQPHPMFTTGDVRWDIPEPPGHLATREEILAHFRRCVDVIRSRVTLVERYGYRYATHAEDATGVTTRFAAVRDGQSPLTVRSPRLIKAFGFDVPTVAPLALASTAVRSLSPHSPELFGAEMDRDDAPLVVVGGGKTGMDTAHALIRRYPGRAVDLVVGRGTIFLNRNHFFPSGLRRWLGGTTSLEFALDIALRFDGGNEAEVLDYFRRNHTVQLGEHFTQYVFGVMSEEENRDIGAGARSVLNEYLADVVDGDGGPVMRFRSGQERPLEAGSWLVNCTGYVMREPSPYEPYLSAGGNVLSVQPTSSIHILTTFGGYFLSHLFFLDRLRETPLYELDHQALLARAKHVFPFASYTHILYNMMQVSETVPASVFTRCGLDFDQWYPLLRRLPALARFRRHKADNIARCRAALDRVRERFDIHCGPLAQAPG
ncbi:MAG: potassium transporter [Gammaproteobacteria bacterium]